MSLKSYAQTAEEQLFVVDPTALMPLEVSVPFGEGEMEHGEHHSHELSPEEMHGAPSLEVSEPVHDMEIVVSELPGAPDGTKDPEPLEVSESPLQVSEEQPSADANDAAKKSKEDKWDWSKHGPHGFVAWVQEKISSVPKHSGYDSAGLERAMAYMEKLDSEISKAMRMDLDEELDANKVEEVRNKLDEGISRLQARLDKVKETKKSSRKRKKSADDNAPEGLVKEAQKILGVQGVYIMAPLLIASIARICINGMVSAGHDIEDLYARQVEQWKLTSREQFELRNLLFDMGVPMRLDRGINPDEDLDTASSDNMDWAANYTDASQSWRR
jgi:hypothetical protein